MDAVLDLLRDYFAARAPVLITMTSGHRYSGPIVNIGQTSVSLDPEADADNNAGQDDWVDRFTLVNLATVESVTYA